MSTLFDECGTALTDARADLAKEFSKVCALFAGFVFFFSFFSLVNVCVVLGIFRLLARARACVCVGSRVGVDHGRVLQRFQSFDGELSRRDETGKKKPQHKKPTRAFVLLKRLRNATQFLDKDYVEAKKVADSYEKKRATFMSAEQKCAKKG